MSAHGLLAWICVLVFSADVSSLIQHGYMTHYFFNHKPVHVNDSMVLELTNSFLADEPGDNYLTCDVNIVTSPSRRIMIHFLSLEISYADKEIDRLHIYDYKTGGEAVRISPSQGLYGMFDVYYNGLARGVADYVSTGNRLKLDYQGKPTLAYNGFKILITSFRDARGDCGRGYIRCNRKEICIPVSTWCDGNHNCGNHDESDEANCNLGLGDDWDPIDGQVTAVVAASVSCTMFLITAAIVAVVIVKLNKRETMNHNITVEFKKKKGTKRQISGNGELYRLYAPPSYEVVIGMNEDPPPYQSLPAGNETESDEEDGVFREQVSRNDTACNVNNESVPLNNAGTMSNHRKHDNTETVPTIRFTSAIVTCDIEGNSNSCSTEVTLESESSGDEECNNSDFLQQTNYRLCSSASPNSPTKKKVQISNHVTEIEVLTSTDDDSDNERNISNKSVPTIFNGSGHPASGNTGNVVPSNGKATRQNNETTNAKRNGHANGKLSNGHAGVSYTRSPSKREADAIEFMDNE